MPILDVDHLRKTFVSRPWLWGKPTAFTAVNNISFSLSSGEILGLLGPNGAGKTTIIQMLLGILTPSAGTITYFGKDFSKQRSDILKNVTFASTYVKLPGRLTVWENLDVYARLYTVPSSFRNERITRFLKLFGMWELRNRAMTTLSAGQTTRVMLAKAFIPQPKIVLLDEPTASLDPDVAREVRSFVVEQKQTQQTSILFTSHNMDEVTQVCDRVLVLKDGVIIADDTPLRLAATIASAHVHLLLTHGIEQAVNYLKHHKLPYSLHEYRLDVEIDEHKVANLLQAFANAGVEYSQISIDKPSLEDYFLTVVRPRRG